MDEDIWNAGNRGPIDEIVANPLRRHHPGGTRVFKHEEMLKRFDGFRFPQDGNEQSIEIFRVEEGKITDVWNPNAIAEQYPAGPWPEFER